MEQIIVTKPNGATYPLAVRRAATNIKSAKQDWALLGNDTVSVTVESPFPQTYGIGDKITVFGRVYKLNRLPKVKKTGMHQFSYDLEFEGIQYDLMRATYDLTIDTTNNQLQDVQADTLTGDLRRFASVLLSNANRVFPNTWVLGSCPDTIEDKTLSFGESDNCLSVLQSLCTEFDVEFEITTSNSVFTINFVSKIGQTFPFTFQFGRGKGLYSLDRQNVDSSNIVTRLKVYGSTSNITNKYRANRLCLPGKTKAQSFIEKADAIAKYGVYEATKYFDDIKPVFNGSITSLVSGSVLQFVDTKMFDLNALEADGVTTKYLIDGCSAKVHFNTGNLAGYQFEVNKYDHATKTFTLVRQTDDRGDVFPSESSTAFQFAQGNEYKLIDIALPEVPYQEDAETKLYEKGNIYYDQNSQPKVQYGLSIAKDYLKKLVGSGTVVNVFQPGDYIPVVDEDIDVNKSVRIKSLTRNLLDEYEYSLTISDTVTTSITNRVISELIDIDKVININNLKDPARARANWRSSHEVLNMVFDPDGDYYTDKIKPNSIDTLALSVGAKSMQFGLANTILQPNFNGNKNIIKVQGGVLTHYTINEESTRSWVLADNTTTFTSNTQAYYIYAKCARSGDAGAIIFSSDQIKVEQDASFYHFWIGVVNSVDVELNARSVSLSYGFTMINGRFVKTGRIESTDSETYFDLDNSEIGGRINFKNGLVSGLVVIGNAEGVNAGMCGEGVLDSSVRIWAGSSKENRGAAPFRVMQDGSVILSKADITGNVNAKTGSIGGFTIKEDEISYGDTSDWALDGTHKAVFNPKKLILQNQDEEQNNSYHRVAFGNEADHNNTNPFGSVGFLHRRDYSSSYNKAFSPVLKIEGYTNWGNGVAVSATGAVRVEGGAIFEKASMVTVDNSAVSMEKLSTFNGSTFIIKNLIANNQIVYLPALYEVKFLHGYEHQNGIMLYTITIVSMVGNRSVLLTKSVDDQSSDIEMYSGVSSINSYTIYAGETIQASLISDASKTYWSIVKL